MKKMMMGASGPGGDDKRFFDRSVRAIKLTVLGRNTESDDDDDDEEEEEDEGNSEGEKKMEVIEEGLAIQPSIYESLDNNNSNAAGDIEDDGMGEFDQGGDHEKPPKQKKQRKRSREENLNDWGGLGEIIAREKYFKEETQTWVPINSNAKFVIHNHGNREKGHRNVRWHVCVKFRLKDDKTRKYQCGSGSFTNVEDAKREVDKVIKEIWAQHGRNLNTNLYLNFPDECDDSVEVIREKNRNEWGGIGEEEARRKYFNATTNKWHGISSGALFVYHESGNKESGHRNVKWRVRLQYSLKEDLKPRHLNGKGCFNTVNDAKVEVDRIIRELWNEHGKENFKNLLCLNFPFEGEETRVRNLILRTDRRDEWGGDGEEEARRQYYNAENNKWRSRSSGITHVKHSNGCTESAHKNVRWKVQVQYQLVGDEKSRMAYGNGSFSDLEEARLEVDNVIRGIWRQHSKDQLKSKHLVLNFPDPNDEEDGHGGYGDYGRGLDGSSSLNQLAYVVASEGGEGAGVGMGMGNYGDVPKQRVFKSRAPKKNSAFAKAKEAVAAAAASRDSNHDDDDDDDDDDDADMSATAAAAASKLVHKKSSGAEGAVGGSAAVSFVGEGERDTDSDSENEANIRKVVARVARKKNRRYE